MPCSHNIGLKFSLEQSFELLSIFWTFAYGSGCWDVRISYCSGKCDSNDGEREKKQISKRNVISCRVSIYRKVKYFWYGKLKLSFGYKSIPQTIYRNVLPLKNIQNALLLTPPKSTVIVFALGAAVTSRIYWLFVVLPIFQTRNNDRQHWPFFIFAE